jgi:outer membrane protein TolC
LALSLVPASAGAAEPYPAAAGVQHDTGAEGVPLVSITLAQALAQAARRAPELTPAFADQAGAGELERASRGVLQRPAELSLSAGPRFGAGTPGIGATLTLLQPVSLGGVGAARRGVAKARRDTARAGLGDARGRAMLATGAAWIEARVAEELLRVRTESVQRAQELDALAAARLASGAATAGERARARSLLGSAHAALLDAEGRKFAAGCELAFQSGSTAEQLEAAGPLDVDGPSVSEAQALAAVLHHPRLVRLAAEANALAQSVRQLRAEGSPFLSVGPSVTREGNGNLILLGHVSLPLPLVNPNDFEAAERSRQALVARAELARERQRLQADVRLALHERLHARLLRDALAQDAIAPARLAVAEATLRYREGKTQLGEVLTARRALSEAVERRIEAAGAARLAQLRLWSAMGQLPREAE